MHLLAVTLWAYSVLGAVKAQDNFDIGPAAFLWPADRPWSAAEDNTPPCGSAAGIGNRTTFPLSIHFTRKFMYATLIKV